MKKSLAIIIALAMILGMSQCKKKVETVTANELDGGVYITLKIIGEGRHDVNTATGRVKYSDGDVIYVGNDGKYCGMLTRTNGQFRGTVYPTDVDDYLHFYFIGGSTPSVTPEVGTTTSFTVNISNQSSNLPVLSYARSNRLYTEGVTEYESFLLNKCGLVKFVPAIATDETVTVGGMKTTATIDFATPGITPTAATGEVTLYPESDAVKWAILLVQNEVSAPSVNIAGYTSSVTSVPAVTENMYYTSGVNIAMAVAQLPYIDALFTVGSTTPGTGTVVKFSRGNLQYLGTGTSGTETPKWRFADNQYDVMGYGSNGGNGNVTIDGYSFYNTGTGNSIPSDADKAAARDLFGWGTSGGGSPATPPYMTLGTVYYNYGGTSDIAGTNRDWGVYNKTIIENNDGKDWRTLTKTEWSNLFNRTKTIGGDSKKLYGFATVMEVKGIVVLPDDWDGTVDGGFTYAGTDFTQNQYTASSAITWSTMESAGAVFMPAAGIRDGGTVNSFGSAGCYWSSSIDSNNDERAYLMRFQSELFYAGTSRQYRHYGFSVRLVFDDEE